MESTIHLSADEISKQIQYSLITQTTLSSRWTTDYKQDLFEKTFTETERKAITELIEKAKMWAIYTGVPSNGITISTEKLTLFQRLAAFCAKL